MRIAVMRNDLPGPLNLSDLEPVSKYNPTTEPRGQETYMSRITGAEIESVLADSTVGAGAALQGTDISGSFPITITGSSNDVLRLKTSSSASFTDVTLAAGAVADIAAMVVVINTALTTAGLGITANVGPGSGDRVQLESDTKGVDSYLELDAVGNGSTANTDLGLTDGVRTMPSAADFIADLAPAGGSLDVSTSTINAVGSGTAASALSIIPDDRGTPAALADLIAPQFADTDVAVDSYLVGGLSLYRSSGYNPDPNRGRLGMPSLANGAAIAVVENDGSTDFGTAHTLPTISSATLSGDLTISGTGFAGENAGRTGRGQGKQTTLWFYGDITKSIAQETLEAAGGTVSSTTIVVPAALITGAATTTTSVKVQVRQRASAVEALA